VKDRQRVAGGLRFLPYIIKVENFSKKISFYNFQYANTHPLRWMGIRDEKEDHFLLNSSKLCPLGKVRVQQVYYLNGPQ